MDSDQQAASAGAPDTPRSPVLENAPTPSDAYTMQEAARLKGVSYHTVSRAVRQGKLQVQRLGRMALIPGDALHAWQPMRERAPRKYRRREPDPTIVPALVDLATGERIELARRLTSLYEIIHSAAREQSLVDFASVVCERFASAMDFPWVALWELSEDLTTLRRIAWVGEWTPCDGAAYPWEFPFPADGTLFRTPRIAPVEPGFNGTPAAAGLDAFGEVLSVPLVAGETFVGVLAASRFQPMLEITDAQSQLAMGIATQAALAIDRIRTRERERARTRALEAVLAHVAESVMVYAPDKRISFLSRRARDVFGLPGDLDLSQRPFTLDDLDRAAVEIDGHGPTDPPSVRALRGETVLDEGFVFVRHDTHERRLLHVDAVPIVDEAGNVTAVVSVERDVEEQRAREERLRRGLAGA